jgi:hypothetical protein
MCMALVSTGAPEARRCRNHRFSEPLCRAPVDPDSRLQSRSDPKRPISLLINKIERVGQGFHNFENYRLRLLLHKASNGRRVACRQVACR